MKRTVNVGGLPVGGGHIFVQSMTTIKTAKTEETLSQIRRLEEAGCEIVRVAVADEADARALKTLKEQMRVPLVADVHFSHRLACLAVENGADKLRINPGNIGGEKEIATVADCLKRHRVPVRVGSNTGSIEPAFYQKYGRSARALVESALYNANILEKHGVFDIVLSVKASDVRLTCDAYTLLNGMCDYPLHLGVTEAGVGDSALIKSAVGIGSLLLQGIGDTIRVSLSADPVEEVYAAKEILYALGLGGEHAEVVACPTCGRCEYECMRLARAVSERVKGVKKSLKIAVMGCVVNGPGEAKGCDLGIAGGKDYCVIMERGKENVRVSAAEAEQAFFARLEALLK